MRRMYSKNELKSLIKAVINEYGVESLVGKDISVNGITSKGIANTGGLANIGDVAISGDLFVQGENKGVITANAVLQKPRYEFNFDLPVQGDLVKEQWYTKVIVIGNELHIIGNAKYTNNTESVIQQRFSAFNIQIPAEIAPFIIDMDGKSLNEAPTSGKNTIRASAVYNFGDDVNVHALRITHASVNEIQIYENQTSNIPANGGVLNKGFHITLMLTE